MDQIQPQLWPLKGGSLAVVQAHGSISIAVGGTPLLEGTQDGSERDGSLHMRFTESSGVSAEFPVIGRCFDDVVDLSGTGTVQLGAFTLCDATVRVTTSAIEITAPFDWADHNAAVKFEAGSEPGCWQGHFDGRETLSCLMTKREVMRTSVSMEIDRAGRSHCRALAVVDGRNIDVPSVSNTREDIGDALARIRRATLIAVRTFLVRELAVSEEKYAAACADDGESSVDTGPIRDDHPPVNGDLPRWNAPVKPVGGYLPASCVQATTVQPASTGRGYLPPASAAPKLVAGYLPRPTAAGYLPSASKAGGGQGQEVPRTAPGKTSRSAVDLSMEFDRIAYAVLRCKDLLQALEARL